MSFAQAGRFSLPRTLQNLKVGSGSVKLTNVKRIVTQASCDPSRRFLFGVVPRLKYHNPDVAFQTLKGTSSRIQVQLRNDAVVEIIPETADSEQKLLEKVLRAAERK